jgi:hypothetical protein
VREIFTQAPEYQFEAGSVWAETLDASTLAKAIIREMAARVVFILDL